METTETPQSSEPSKAMPKLADKGDYFQTHEVTGKTVTRTLEVDPERYGNPDHGEKILVKEVTIPVYDETGLYVIRALRHDLPESNRPPSDERHTLILMGGGGSEAVGNVGMLARVIDGLEKIRNNLPFDINRIIVAPHIAGTPRTLETERMKEKEIKEATQHPNLSETARILKKALKDPEIHLSHEGIEIAGFSAGGAQSVELAALYGDQCKNLILADPAGLSDHPNLYKEFSIGTIKSAFKKYRGRGQSRWQSLKSAIWEARVAWCNPSGTPNIVEMGKDLIRKQHPWTRRVASAYGFRQEQGHPPKDYDDRFTKDITQTARKNVKARIILAPIKYAKVVNDILERAQERYILRRKEELAKKYPDEKTRDRIIKEEAKARYSDPEKAFERFIPESEIDYILSEIFPSHRIDAASDESDEDAKPQLHLVDYQGHTHPEVMNEQTYWDKVFEEMLQVSRS